MTRIAIVGSRTYYNLDQVTTYVAWLSQHHPDTVIVSGGAAGVDQAAETAANTHGLKTSIFPADWDRHGKSAGFKRNQLIVDYCNELIAFWDGKSRGTAHSIDLAKKANRPVVVVVNGMLREVSIGSIVAQRWQEQLKFDS